MSYLPQLLYSKNTVGTSTLFGTLKQEFPLSGTVFRNTTSLTLTACCEGQRRPLETAEPLRETGRGVDN